MLENLKRQEAVSPIIDRARTLEMLFEIQTLYFGDEEAVLKYGDPAYWEDLSGGRLTCCCRDSNNEVVIDYDKEVTDSKDDKETSQDDIDLSILPNNLLKEITTKGYFVLPPPMNSNTSPTALSSTLQALKSTGWPPQFLLMYNEVWELLKNTIHAIFGDDNICDNFYIESDVNIWSLQRNSSSKYYIGGNFINPHRDMVYNACHDENDNPTSLSVWIPLNPSGATSHNGCMRIIPVEGDDFFYSPQHPNHSVNSNYGEEDAEKLVCPQFGACVWDPSCVHWGGSCEGDAPLEEEPRSSLAFTIRLGGKAAHFGTTASTATSSCATEQTGPEACLVKNCDKGDCKRRLQMVAKSLLSYSHHWPGFPFDGFRENMGLSR